MLNGQFSPGKISAFLIYVVVFAVLFMQFPLKNALPGLIDSWWYINLFNYYGNLLSEFFTGQQAGYSAYPQGQIQYHGEACYGGGAIYLFIKQFGFNAIVTWYLFISFIYASNAFGVYLLSLRFKLRPDAAFFAGLFFAASAISLGNIDDVKVILFFPMLLSLTCFMHYLQSQSARSFYLAFIISAIGIWFSSYNFVFNWVVLAILVLVYAVKNFVKISLPVWHIASAMILHLLIIFPFAWVYVINPEFERSSSGFNVFEHHSAVCLQLADFFQPLRNNLLYPSGFEQNPQWIFSWHSFFFGVSLFILALIGWLKSPFKLVLSLLFIASLILAIGPYINLGNTQIKAPMYYVYEFIPIANLIRIPVRFGFIAMIALAILGGTGLSYLLHNSKLGKLSLLLAVFFFIENVPFPFHSYSAASYVKPPALYGDYFSDKEQSVLLNLPSSVIDRYYVEGFSAPAREYVYMYWQTQNRNFVVNGTSYDVFGGVTHENLLLAIKAVEDIDLLVDSLNLSHIAFHKQLHAPWENDSIYQFMQASSKTIIAAEDEEVAIFECRR